MTQAASTPARLWLIFAAKAPRAVILRQGPTDHVRMIVWHMDKDRFEDGQWVTHRVDPHRAGLSPGGRYLVWRGYRQFDRQGAWLGTFTAVSRPPYFTALAFVPACNPFGGGGAFLDDRHLWIDGAGPHAAAHARLPKELRLVHGTAWASNDRRARWRLPPERFAYANGRPARIRPQAVKALAEGFPNAGRDGLSAHYPGGVEVLNGVLYRRRNGTLKKVRDFNDMQYEVVRAPYAGVSR